MGAMMLIGSLLTAFGPPAVFFLSYVWGDAALLILSVASAFFAYCWTLLTSFFWLAVPPLQDVHAWPLTVNPLIAEAVRAGFLVGYMRVERMADRMSSPLAGPKVFVDLPSAISAGAGMGLMVTIMRYGAALAAAGGRGAWYYPTCPVINAFIYNSVSALLTNMLHIIVTILLLDALRRRSIIRGSMAVVLHVLFSIAGALTAVQDGCVAVLPIWMFLVLAGGYGAYRVVSAPDYAGTRQLKAWALLRSRATGSADTGTGADRRTD